MEPPASIDGLDVTAARRRLWLAALHQLALADGDFSPDEKRLLEEELTPHCQQRSPLGLNHPPGGSTDDDHDDTAL